MIGKLHDAPLNLLKMDALLRRLPPYHNRYEEVKEQLKMYSAGFYGEKSIDFPLSFLEEKRFMIYHDLRLYDGTHHFQIDTLVISQHYILIIEVKNISGTLMFDPIFNQMIRISNTKEEAFPDPLIQVERQRYQLQLFLSKLKLPKIPIETLIVISNRSTVLKATHEIDAITSKVIRSEYLPTKVRSIDKRYPIEILTMKQVRKLGRFLVKQHDPLDRDILKQFSIPVADLLVGVQCSSCARLPMLRVHGKWFCESCSFASKNAHLKAINDYALLISKEITNQEFRGFLELSSEDAATRLLKSMNLEFSGANKGRRYLLDIHQI
ncbi:nuclease-related domain-containing protein [Alkalihalobacillus macyae]|uniref:nuclease-related domain-containing protein n=1 Tax=Guptibacillus hwajinpoensis TaxID=208199 RepID=UPI00273B497A|nr:nuclease-related domain-containing protein [Alkalihalobacillus macyae]MDP4551966.1 nuclease-related domain-containing protein [Alkalihalobacillus macyae]